MGRQRWQLGTSTSDTPAMPAASATEQVMHPHCSAERQAPPYRLQPVGPCWPPYIPHLPDKGKPVDGRMRYRQG